MAFSSDETQEFYEKLMRATNAVGGAHFDKQNQQEHKVKINPDKRISPAMFKPDPDNSGQFLAHPTTIRAMRKDLFVGGSDEFIDLEKLYTCESCQNKVDVQFWQFCPYCEASFPKKLKLI